MKEPMKTWTISKVSAVIAAAALPLLGGCAREQVKVTPAAVTNGNPAAVVTAPAPEVADQELATAPARLVSRPQPTAQGVALDAAAAELVRLTQSGVDEKVMLAYVNNSASTFNLGSDQIIYLNDIGMPSSVVTAMIQHDQVFKTANTALTIAPAPAPAPAPVPETVSALAMAQDAPAPQANVTATYFYDSLAPYGNWIEVEGYGRCWQPAAEVVDRSWTPYCDRGHWVFSDCGWYWASDYSWGWAPFHYGRWFRHNFWGWCWAPDTVWGPSWVSWRYNEGYCGWAPLPPTACYRPGFGFSYYGRSVGASFEFGLGADCFTFVAADRFCDARPYQHRIPHHQVTQIFNSTVIINPVAEERGNPRFHRGIPSKHIAEITHVELKPVKIQETPNRPEHGERHDAGHGTLTVFQPHLPLPPVFLPGHRIGEGIKPATPDTVIRRDDSESKMHRGIPGKVSAPETVNSRTPERPGKTVPTSTGTLLPPKTESPRPGIGNNQHRITHDDGNTPNPTASKIERAVPLHSPGPTGQPATPNTPPPQNHFTSPRPAQPTLPPVAVEPPQPTEPVRPARHEQPTFKPASQPQRQPRQEMSLPTPAAPAAPVQLSTPPPARNYQAPQPFAPREAHEIPAPAPERTGPSRSQPEISSTPSRVVVPQIPPPHIEAPQGSSRPIPAAQPSPDSSRKSDGGSRDKRSDGGNSPRNR